MLLLPVLFTVSEEVPTPSIADTLDNLFAAEATYPAGLRRCKSNHRTGVPADFFVDFNPCVQIDARGITPFLPYIIRSDLIRLLGDSPSPPPVCSVRVSKLFPD